MLKSMGWLGFRLLSSLGLPIATWALSLLGGCGAWVTVAVPALPRSELRCDAVEVTLLDGQRLWLAGVTLSPSDLRGEVVWVERPTTRIELGLSRTNGWHGELSTVGTLRIRTTTFGQQSVLIREDQELACWRAR